MPKTNQNPILPWKIDDNGTSLIKKLRDHFTDIANNANTNDDRIANLEVVPLCVAEAWHWITVTGGASATAITFDGVLVDTANMWPSANPTRIVIPKTGFYQVSSQIYFPDAMTSGEVGFYYYANGNPFCAAYQQLYSSSVESWLSGFPAVWYLQQNTYIELFIYVANTARTGGNSTEGSGTRHGTRLQVLWVSNDNP